MIFDVFMAVREDARRRLVLAILPAHGCDPFRVEGVLRRLDARLDARHDLAHLDGHVADAIATAYYFLVASRYVPAPEVRAELFPDDLVRRAFALAKRASPTVATALADEFRLSV